MNKYLASIATNFHESLVYRGKIFIYILQSFLYIFIMPFVWLQVYGQGEVIGGFNAALMVSYFFFMPLIDIVTVSFSYDWMQIEIKEGDIIKSLVKPINYIFYNLTSELGYKPIRFIPTLLVMSIAFPFVKNYLTLPSFNWQILWLVPLLVLAYIIFFLISCLIGFAAFWTIEAYWSKHLWWILSSFAGGYLAPITFYPEIVQKILHYTPFPLLMQIPLQVLLGMLSSTQIIEKLIIGILWVIILIILVAWMWKRGVKRADIVGR